MIYHDKDDEFREVCAKLHVASNPLDYVYDIVLHLQKMHGTMVPRTAALRRTGLTPDIFEEAVAIWAAEDILQAAGDMLRLAVILE